ncbi:acyl carrier protein [Desertimonas flava]|jgi:acyl carrier protein|uniref:acyl carrier protein n=1 Tax=Desertimonas flava TaxID=2064846 RepID=UPI000E34FCFF|nr:acyl carrier protein [Desertimonas flava]
MNRHEAEQLVREALDNIAPELDAAQLSVDDDFRTDLDLDSMDFLNLVVAISQRSGRDIPERDYPQIVTFGGFVDYLAGDG